MRWPPPRGSCLPRSGPALLALAALAASAGGRAGGVVVAAVAAFAPVPGPVRAAIGRRPLWSRPSSSTATARARRTLRARTFTDRLTGLRNYDYFSEVLRSELARVRRYGGCVTLVMLDLDRFKAYNDSHGHGAGNRLLAVRGPRVAREKRDADIAARFGGEEFALLVPGRGTEAVIVAERVRQAIAEHLDRAPSTATTCPTSSPPRPESPRSRWTPATPRSCSSRPTGRSTRRSAAAGTGSSAPSRCARTSAAAGQLEVGALAVEAGGVQLVVEPLDASGRGRRRRGGRT